MIANRTKSGVMINELSPVAVAVLYLGKSEAQKFFVIRTVSHEIYVTT
jgi:hypothetical protein